MTYNTGTKSRIYGTIGENDKKNVKRRLLGFCGTETVKTQEEIAAAFRTLPYGDDMAESLTRQFLSIGHMSYRGKVLSFTRVVDEDNVARYRVTLENSRKN